MKKDDTVQLRLKGTGTWVEGRLLSISSNNNAVAISCEHIPILEGFLMNVAYGPVVLLIRQDDGDWLDAASSRLFELREHRAA
jgi:hypothetical protein